MASQRPVSARVNRRMAVLRTERNYLTFVHAPALPAARSSNSRFNVVEFIAAYAESWCAPRVFVPFTFYRKPRGVTGDCYTQRKVAC